MTVLPAPGKRRQTTPECTVKNLHGTLQAKSPRSSLDFDTMVLHTGLLDVACPVLMDKVQFLQPDDVGRIFREVESITCLLV